MIINKETTIAYHCHACGSSIIGHVNIFSFTNKMLRLKCVCGDSEMVLKIGKDNKILINVPCIICPSSHDFTLSSPAFFERDIFTLSCSMTALNICFFGEKENVLAELEKTEEDLVALFAAENQIADENDNFFREVNDLYNSVKNKIPPGEDSADADGDFGYDEEFGELLRILSRMPGGKAPDDDSAEYNLVKPAAVEPVAGELFKNKSVTEGVLREIAFHMQNGSIICTCGGKKKGSHSLTAEYDKLHLTCEKCGDTRVFSVASDRDLEYMEGMEMIVLDDGK